MRCKTQQNNVLRAKKVAIPFSEAQIGSAHFFATQQFSPACFPLPVRGIGRDLCKMVITSPPPTPDGRQKKEPRKKGSFVRIKVLRYNRNLSVYQNIKRTFKAWLPPCPPVLCAALHRVCIFLSDNAKVVKIPEFSKCGKLCGNRRFFVYLVL